MVRWWEGGGWGDMGQHKHDFDDSDNSKLHALKNSLISHYCDLHSPCLTPRTNSTASTHTHTQSINTHTHRGDGSKQRVCAGIPVSPQISPAIKVKILFHPWPCSANRHKWLYPVSSGQQWASTDPLMPGHSTQEESSKGRLVSFHPHGFRHLQKQLVGGFIMTRSNQLIAHTNGILVEWGAFMEPADDLWSRQECTDENVLKTYGADGMNQISALTARHHSASFCFHLGVDTTMSLNVLLLLLVYIPCVSIAQAISCWKVENWFKHREAHFKISIDEHKLLILILLCSLLFFHCNQLKISKHTKRLKGTLVLIRQYTIE